MIKLLGKVPRNSYIAVSGGSDSMAALDFLHNGGRRNLVALHFNHGTEHADKAESLVRSFCLENEIPAVFGKISEEAPKGSSKEDFWRKQRYSFFNKVTSSNYDYGPVITCHHLDDAVETWLFTSLHGNPKTIPPKRGPYIRPFLLTNKESLTNWCLKRSIPYVFDPSNNDTKYMRNYIRHNIVPLTKNINPGLNKVIKKKILASFSEENN